MPKFYEVNVSDLLAYNRRSRRRPPYITYAHKAEEARKRAEERLEQERSGELRRQKVTAEATRLQLQLQTCSEKLKWLGEDVSILAPALEPLTTDSHALEQWIEHASILHHAVATELKERLAERARRKHLEHDEMLRLKKEQGDYLLAIFWTDAQKIVDGDQIADKALIASVERFALELSCNGYLGHDEYHQLRERLKCAYDLERLAEEEREGWEKPFLIQTKKDLLALRSGKGPHCKTRQHPDHDLRRQWRRERRLTPM